MKNAAELKVERVVASERHEEYFFSRASPPPPLKPRVRLCRHAASVSGPYACEVHAAV